MVSIIILADGKVRSNISKEYLEIITQVRVQNVKTCEFYLIQTSMKSITLLNAFVIKASKNIATLLQYV